jgi:hypothetical protein
MLAQLYVQEALPHDTRSLCTRGRNYLDNIHAACERRQVNNCAALIPHLLADTPSVYTDDAHSRLRSCNIDMKLSVCDKRCKTPSHTIVILSIDRCYTG